MSFKVFLITKADLKKPQIAHEKPFLVLSYYSLHPLESPQNELALHHAHFAGRDVKARIYIAKQGVNGTLSASIDVAYAYMKWLTSRKEFSGICFKAHESDAHVFDRLQVKIRKELVAYGENVSLEDQGTRLSPKQWRESLEGSEEKAILDIRNDYEWELGHFEGAEKPNCINFKDFKAYAQTLKTKVDPKKTKVMMYCTGGIRCEFFSSILKQDGFEHVGQLDGGIINYGVQEKAKHWKGKLFVFDDRLSIPIADEQNEVIGQCHHCSKPIDRYYNCANVECNTLFLCCPECVEVYKGCCKESCSHAENVRPYAFVHTPFRRKNTYTHCNKEVSCTSNH